MKTEKYDEANSLTNKREVLLEWLQFAWARIRASAHHRHHRNRKADRGHFWHAMVTRR
jgi:hypothetical protein